MDTGEKDFVINLVLQLMDQFEENDLKSILDCFLGTYLDSEDVGELVAHYNDRTR